MSELLAMLMSVVMRMSLALLLTAGVAELAIRCGRTRLPRLERVLWGLVLVQGIVIVQPSISLPILSPAAVASSTDLIDAPFELTAPVSVGSSEPTTPALAREPMAISPGRIEPTSFAARTISPPRANHLRRPFMEIAGHLWLVGILGLSTIGLVRYARFVKQVKSIQPVPAEWQQEWLETLRDGGSAAGIELVVTRSVGPALVRHPRGYRLVVPLTDWESLTSPQRKAVLRHELAHYQNGDIWWTLAARLILLIHWLNPAAWLAVRRFEAQTEYLCDEYASGSQPAEFASALIRLGSLRTQSQLAVQSARDGGLFERVERLLTERNKTPYWRAMGVIASLVLSIFASQIDWQLVAAEPRPRDRQQPNTNQPDAIDPAGGGPRQIDENAEQDSIPQGKATISGLINLIDGSPATTQGRVYYRSHVRGRTQIGNGGFRRDRFEITVPSGEVTLHYFLQDYAPARIGPFTLQPGQQMGDAQFVLMRGENKKIQVRGPDGNLIASSRIQLQPQFDSYSIGPSQPFLDSDSGVYKLTNLAHVPYSIEVIAPGFQPKRIQKQALEPYSEPLVIALKRSEPATGVVLNPDGSAAGHASFQLMHQIDESKFYQDFGNDPQAAGAIAQADDQGRFSVDQLTDGTAYLFAIFGGPDFEFAALRDDITSGRKDLVVRLAPRPRIQIEITGDLSKLHRFQKKPVIKFQQSVSFRQNSVNSGNSLLAGDIDVTVDDKGGHAQLSLLPVDPQFPGTNTVALSLTPADQFERVIQIGSDPNMTVSFELPKQTPLAVEPNPKPTAVIRGKNYLIVPWKMTPLQGGDPGSSDITRDQYKAYVLIDGVSLYSRDGRLDQDALDWDELAKHLTPLSAKKPSIVIFNTYYFSAPGFRSTNSANDLLDWALEGFGRQRAGFTNAYWARTGAGEGTFWEMIEKARDAQGDLPEGGELPIGDDLVQVYPVETFLSRVRTRQSDCEAYIVPRITKEMGTSLPQSIHESLRRHVTAIKLQQRKHLTLHINYNRSASQIITSVDASLDQLAKEFGFDEVRMSWAQYDD